MADTNDATEMAEKNTTDTADTTAADTADTAFDDEEIDKVSQDAMQIILHAGDARVEVKHAYELVAAGDIEGARAALSSADEKIVQAHHIQTEDIQATIRGEKQDYSLLFAHAQDTLMTIYSEIIVAKQLLGVFESLERRVSALEAR